MLLEFLPGHLAPSLTRRAFWLRRCFPLFHLTHFLPSIQQGPRQHILWLSQRRWLFGPSFRKRHWLAPTRSIDLSCESALAVSPFQSSVLCDHRCVPVHRAPSWVSRERRTILPLSPFVAGGAVTILVKPLILRRLGPLLQRFYRTFTYVSGWKHCSSSSPTSDLSQSRLLFGSPLSSRFPDWWPVATGGMRYQSLTWLVGNCAQRQKISCQHLSLKDAAPRPLAS